MTVVFLIIAVFCGLTGLCFWFYPKAIIMVNDWMTEKTLLHASSAMFYRLIIGAVFIAVAVIFFWTLVS